ncbi:MAG: IS1634 family transposase [Lentimicrobium sp.]
MFIKIIPKKDKNTGKVYHYHRLCESYRLGDSVRHRTILSLGLLDDLKEPKQFKLLADRIEQLIKVSAGLFECGDAIVEKLALSFYREIIDKKLIDRTPSISKPEDPTLYTVDINSLELENARETGSEWMCLQALRQLEMDRCLKECGFDPKDVPLALAHLISRAVYPASEYGTVQWMQDNSSVCELIRIDPYEVTHHHLYRISRLLSQNKDSIESWLSKKTSSLFDLQDTIILYDLTNTYFEGRKLASKLAAFGKSKEKRSDARLITLALVVNVAGFVKHSQIYRGNMSDPETLQTTLAGLSQYTEQGQSPLIVIDAGISSDENLTLLRNKGFNYLCVTRSRLKDYTAAKEGSNPVTITDKRKSNIELLLIKQKESEDNFLYVRSERKAHKEVSMHQNFTSHFEQGLEQILHGITTKGGTKKLVKVWERIGRLKEKYSSAHGFYQIEVESKKDEATNLTWQKIVPPARKNEGVYFLRTSLKEIDENTFWTIYNTIREIESSFRTLKTDLLIRPVFHKTDDNTIAHLNLAVLAYQLVNSIRFQLKAKGINHDWSHLVRIMNTQKAVTVTMLDKQSRKIYIRKCTKPESQVSQIYNALGYKHYPFIRKSVLPENKMINDQIPDD